MAETAAELGSRLRNLKQVAQSALEAAGDLAALQALRDRFLGRKSGELTGLMKALGGLAPDQKKAFGQELNALKQELEASLHERQGRLEAAAEQARLGAEALDLSLPGRRPSLGRRHPLTVAREDLEDVFVAMGYEVYDGPEVEDDYHCFEALNMPPDHPARDMQDTFYLEGGSLLLRTHTSSAQIHYLLDNPHPPHVRIICPGKVYRRDSDVTHSPMFNQIEGLVVGPGITLGHLKGTIEAFLHGLFGPQYPVRFRPSYFPYTEPSVEADLACIVCGGGGRLASGDPCRICKTTGWIEILGSGMVDPAVFEAVNARLGRVLYDPEQVSGFAFGLGIERVAMVRHGIDDIRSFFENDVRLLEQFAG